MVNDPTNTCAALVVTFDQLPASILGCYGNEWIETPHLDRMAADGLVGDQCWSAHVGPTTAENVFAAQTSLATLKSSKLRTALLREDVSNIEFPRAVFDQIQEIGGERGSTAKPDRIPFAELVRAAQSTWEKSSAENESCLIWLHARGLEIPAVSPVGFAELYQDEFEDRGVKFEMLSDVERQNHPLAAAGLVSLFDHWLGQLFAGFNDFQRPLLTVVTAAQGAAWQPLPNAFGSLDELRSVMTHVPWIMNLGGTEDSTFPAGLRDPHLGSTRSLGPLLKWWLGDETSWSAGPAQLPTNAGPILTTSSTHALRITTADWAAIFPPAPATDVTSLESKPLLFRKPEDFWEVNNLAEIRLDVIEELHAAALNLAERGT